MMRDLWGDLTGGVRALRRSGAFTAFAVATLGLGIGATTAVFSVVDRVVLRPLPYPGSELMALVGIRSRMDPESRGPLSTPLVLALSDEPGPAEAVVAAGAAQRVFDDGGDPERMVVTRVSEGFFPFFGARARVGRLLTDADQAPDAARAAVLGNGMWRSRYGGDPTVVGRTIRLDDEPYTVVGVLARDFVPPPELADDGQLWVPLRLREGEADRGSFSMVGAARLRPGATVEEMEARVSQVVADAYPPGDGPGFVTGGAAVDFRDEVVGPISATLGRVLAAVGLLLLIACVNVASLLLTRGAERTHELSVRAALGAGRGRLLRQLLSESLVLALVGGASGGALAYGAVELFRRTAPPGLPRLAEVAVDGRGFGFALALAVAVGSGLLARDLIRMATRDHGVRVDGVASMRVNLSPRYQKDEWVGMWQRFLDGARGLPGATAVAVASQVPFTGDRIASTYRPEGVEGDDAEGVFAITVAVGGDYLPTLGARLAQGRAFGPEDDGSAPLILVNEAFVRRFWPGGNGVGKHVLSGGAGVDDEPDYEVVGVVRDVTSRVERDAAPTIFLPMQEQPWRDMEVMVRTDGDAVTMGAALRATRSRLREIGIRLALGARTERVVAGVVGRTAVAVGGGVVLGLTAAALASRAMADVLHEVDPRDVPAYAAVGALGLGSGTLYEAVHRLLGQGMLKEVGAPDDEPASGGPPRRFYALTAQGRATLADELRRMEAVVRFARDRDLLPEI